MVYVYVPAFWGAFSQILVQSGDFHHKMKAPIYINWYFEQMLVKKSQLEQNWILFCTKLVYILIVGKWGQNQVSVERKSKF